VTAKSSDLEKALSALLVHTAQLTKMDTETMETTATARTNQKITLSDGRILAYDEYGDPDGMPIIFMHGFPGSRLDWRMFNLDGSLAAGLHARILAIDCPGMGRLDFKQGRELLDWPDNILELANAVLLQQQPDQTKFAILAGSDGGPYGEVCAFKIPERITKTAIVCGMGPREAPGTREGLSWTLPGKPWWLRRLILTLMAQTV
jgi:pimeloyl-ACP methyl ester carboxylesterase